jgi:hypothetical protein
MSMVDCDESLKKHISLIKAKYCYLKRLGMNKPNTPRSYLYVFEFGNVIHLELTIKNNVTLAMGPPYTMNPIT